MVWLNDQSLLNKMYFKILLFIIGAGLTACSSLLVPSATDHSSTIDGSLSGDIQVDSLIAPYARELAKEMNLQIGVALADLSVKRPNSNLGEWVCDALVSYASDSLGLKQEKPVAILNTGGLRASLSKGAITVGDIFKLMPFDNQLVALKISTSKITELETFFKQTGGEPISGFKIVKGKANFDTSVETNGYFWVITTDFLANGGDKMTFLLEPLEKRLTKVLLRDVLIQTVKKQQTIGAEIQEERITW